MIRREARHARDGQAGAHHRQDERAGRGGRDPRALRGVAGRRARSTSSCAVPARCGPACRALSENIRVRSILGRFLEHHRVWYFANDGDPDVWLVVGRLDGAQPVQADRGRVPGARSRAAAARHRRGAAAPISRDNRDAWELQADGQWTKVRRGAASARPARNCVARRPSCSRGLRERTGASRRASAVRTSSEWRHHGPDPLAPRRSRARRARPRAAPDGQGPASRPSASARGSTATCRRRRRILVSPADRAQQTALALKRKFKTVDALAPGAERGGRARGRGLARRARAGRSSSATSRRSARSRRSCWPARRRTGRSRRARSGGCQQPRPRRQRRAWSCAW